MPVRLFVGNLPYDATEEEIREHFSTVGPVSYVFIPIDRETGKKRGFAFIEFDNGEKAQEAIRQFNNQPFKGRPLAVNEARARESRPAAAPGGFRSAGGPRLPVLNRSPDSGFGQGAMEVPRADRPNRKFGPDSKPARVRSQRFSKPEGVKRELKEKFTGQLFGVDEDDDSGTDLDPVEDFSRGLDEPDTPEDQ